MSYCSPAMENAWRGYLKGVEAVRRLIYEHPFAALPEGRDRAHYLFHQVQAAGFNVAFGPRQESPRFFANILFEPSVYGWTSPGADFVYRKAFVDGSRSYRIWGKRSNANLTTLQVMGAYWDDPAQMADLGYNSLDDFTSPDGSFEFIASPEYQEGHWVKLDPSKRKIVLMIRDIFNDWENETGSEVHIEMLGPPASVHGLDEGEIIARMEGAVRFMQYVVSTYSATMIEDAQKRGGYNTLTDYGLGKSHANSGVNPIGGFFTAFYSIEEDEAWIVELRDLKARHWTFQHSDLWHQAVNYIDHQSSLNGHQAIADSDDVVRIVVSMTDPGVPNWIDTLGLGKGGIDFRFLYPDKIPEIRSQLVKLNDLRATLPDTTPRVDVEARAKILRARRRAGLRRWGY